MSARLIDDEMRAADLTIAPDARAALIPLLGGDRRASRAELRKLALYANGQERVEIDDVMAVVADASALALDSLVDAAFAGRLADVEKEFAKAAVAGTNGERDRRRGVAPDRAAACAAPRCRERHAGVGHRGAPARNSFPPQAADRSRVERLDVRAARQAMSMLAEASLDARKQSDLGETIAHRALC